MTLHSRESLFQKIRRRGGVNVTVDPGVNQMHNVDLMLGQRRRRWTSIKSTLNQKIQPRKYNAYAGSLFIGGDLGKLDHLGRKIIDDIISCPCHADYF